MRVLITIPHFFNAEGDGRYGSTQPNPQPRLAALTQCLRSLVFLSGERDQFWFRDGNRLQPGPANRASHAEIDIVICTCGDRHMLEQLQIPPDTYEHRSFDCDPMYLGFECHGVLHERLGSYDLYGFMEDDLIIHDPAFFTKIVWFHGITDADSVLQPNRYERHISPTQIKKVYIDFEFSAEADLASPDAESVTVDSCGQEIELRRTSNPHSGCFFLTRKQMKYWADQRSLRQARCRLRRAVGECCVAGAGQDIQGAQTGAGQCRVSGDRPLGSDVEPAIGRRTLGAKAMTIHGEPSHCPQTT